MRTKKKVQPIEETSTTLSTVGDAKRIAKHCNALLSNERKGMQFSELVDLLKDGELSPLVYGYTVYYLNDENKKIFLKMVEEAYHDDPSNNEGATDLHH